MPEKLPSHFLDLVHSALLKSFWRKPALATFLRRHNVSESFLAGWHDPETKRVFLGRLFPELERHEKGSRVIKHIAASLADQTTFPDLEGWEDSTQKIATAREAVKALRGYLEAQEFKANELRQREEIQKKARQHLAEQLRAKQSLQKLEKRLAELSKKMGTQEAGYDFQTWFYDLADFYEIPSRRPYWASGRQIDGSITIEGTTYLVELKFTNDQADAPDVDTFLIKVRDKADNTMGIMVSMSSYSKTACTQASGRGSPLLLLDYSHIYLALRGDWKFEEIVSRVRRHASQTGEALLPVAQFTG